MTTERIQKSHTVGDFVVILLEVMSRLSVSLPTDAVLCEDGKGTKICIATAAPNINKEIIKGISRFLIRDFFSDDVSLVRSLTSHTVAFDSFPCSFLRSLVSRDSRVSWN